MLLTLYLAGIIIAIFICMIIYQSYPPYECPVRSDEWMFMVLLWPLVAVFYIVAFGIVGPMWWSAGKIANLFK